MDYTVCMNRGRSPPSQVWRLAPSEHPGWSTPRRREQTDVAAGQLGQAQTELLAQFCAYLISWITTRFPPGRQLDAISMRFAQVKIEFDCRILTQLVLEPVGGIGQRVFVLGGTGHCLPV